MAVGEQDPRRPGGQHGQAAERSLQPELRPETRTHETLKVRLLTIENVPKVLLDTMRDAAIKSWEIGLQSDIEHKLPSTATAVFILAPKVFNNRGAESLAHYDDGTKRTRVGLDYVRRVIGVEALDESEQCRKAFAFIGAHETWHKVRDAMGVESKDTASMSSSDHDAEALEIEADKIAGTVLIDMFPASRGDFEQIFRLTEEIENNHHLSEDGLPSPSAQQADSSHPDDPSESLSNLKGGPGPDSSQQVNAEAQAPDMQIEDTHQEGAQTNEDISELEEPKVESGTRKDPDGQAASKTPEDQTPTERTEDPAQPSQDVEGTATVQPEPTAGKEPMDHAESEPPADYSGPDTAPSQVAPGEPGDTAPAARTEEPDTPEAAESEVDPTAGDSEPAQEPAVVAPAKKGQDSKPPPQTRSKLIVEPDPVDTRARYKSPEINRQDTHPDPDNNPPRPEPEYPSPEI